jgi:hypothetical protein
LDENMGTERDVILHQRVGELEQIRDSNLASLRFPLLFSHGELGWHLAVRYQGDATSHNNNRTICRNFTGLRLYIKSNGHQLLHSAARLFLCAVYALITEMRVPCLHVSRGASKLLLLLLLFPVYYSINLIVINHGRKCF